MKGVVILAAQQFPDCVATAAFASEAYGWEAIVISSTAEPTIGGGDELYIIGTHYQKYHEALKKAFKKVHIYSFGEDVKKEGAIRWLIELHGKPEGCSDKLIELVNARCFGKTNEEIETFSTGVRELSFGSNLYSVFFNLWSNLTDIATVMEVGKPLFKNHQGIASERVTVSSNYIGKIAYAEARDLINLTHLALIAKYPDANFTVTTCFQFDKDVTWLRYSIRAYNGNDALELAKDMDDVGGSKDAAGGKVRFDLARHLVFLK